MQIFNNLHKNDKFNSKFDSNYKSTDNLIVLLKLDIYQ